MGSVEEIKNPFGYGYGSGSGSGDRYGDGYGYGSNPVTNRETVHGG